MLAVYCRRRRRRRERAYYMMKKDCGMMVVELGGLKEFTFSKVAYLLIFSYLGTSIVYLNVYYDIVALSLFLCMLPALHMYRIAVKSTYANLLYGNGHIYGTIKCSPFEKHGKENIHTTTDDVPYEGRCM